MDNGDGTVTDHATGLMWAKADSGEVMDWDAALAYAENSTLGGYGDWRLPNVKELQSIVDYTRSPSAADAANVGPAIDTHSFEITELPAGTTNYETDYGYFWSSTSAYFGGDSLEYYYAWYVPSERRSVTPAMTLMVRVPSGSTPRWKAGLWAKAVKDITTTSAWCAGGM